MPNVQMNSNELPEEPESLSPRTGGAGLLYEVFPDLTYHSDDAVSDWYEIALYAAVAPDDVFKSSENREQMAALNQTAAFLMSRISSEDAVERSVSAWRYTLRTSRGAPRPQLYRSVSVFVAGIAPYRKGEEPALLTVLKRHLQYLGIPKIERGW